MKKHIWRGIKMVLVLAFTVFLLWAVKLDCANSWAVTKKISGTTNIEDTYMVSGLPNNGYGAAITHDFSVAENYSGSYNRALIRVKNVASELGLGATNITAVCSLYCHLQYGGADNISVHRVFKPWVEGTLDYQLCTGTGNGATWNDWDCLDLEWGTAGCSNASDAGSDNSGDGTDYDRKATAESNVDVTTINTWYAWSISTELATGWYNGTIAENGIILIGSSGSGSNRFYSSESGTNPPFFVFTYDTVVATTKLLPIKK